VFAEDSEVGVDGDHAAWSGWFVLGAQFGVHGVEEGERKGDAGGFEECAAGKWIFGNVHGEKVLCAWCFVLCFCGNWGRSVRLGFTSWKLMPLLVKEGALDEGLED